MRFPNRIQLATVLVAAAGCVPHNGTYIGSDAPLGRVVIYRSGVAFYERRATVDNGHLTVRVPRERVDDFLKSLTVVDTVTKTPLPVTIPRQQADDGAYLTMELETPSRARANVMLTYVTESPAWKPSYRVAVAGNGKVMLEGWAIVDNTSGEDWKGVQVGVGASSALSFRYDLWSVRTVDREQLSDQEQFAVAPPTGVSPYGGADAAGGAAPEEVVELGDDEIRRQAGDAPLGAAAGSQSDALGTSFSGAVSAENTYTVDGVNTTGIEDFKAEEDTITGGYSADYGTAKAPRPTIVSKTSGAIQGQVRDAKTREPLVGVTVVAVSPAMQGTQTAITDEKGAYTISQLPPGKYEMVFYYNDLEIQRKGVAVAVGKRTTVHQKLDQAAGGGEKIEIQGSAPVIDQGSTRTGVTISQDYTRNIPVGTGRTFTSTLGSAAGSQGGPAPTSPPPTADGDRKIKELVEKLKGKRTDVVIEAHANAGVGNAAVRANDRANVVKNQLVDAGVAPARIKIATKIAGGETENVKLLLAAPSRDGGEHAKGAAATPAGPVDDTPVGESHFLAERPMNVNAGTSAMVSMLRKETPGGVVYLYDPVSDRGNARYAFRAVRLDNPTDDTLEAGPVTVYGDKRFIGEGLTESIPPRATAVVPFALDRQIVVEPTVEDDDQISKLITLERGVLTAEVQHERRTHLAITSRLHHATRLYIRHRLDDGWTLTEAPHDDTRVGDAHLFAVDIPAGATRDIVIAEATPLQRTLQLASPAALGMLEIYVASPHPSAALKDGLTDLLATHRAIVDVIERIETLRDQLGEYRTRSDELHGQLLTLKAVKTGGELMRVLKAKMVDMSERVQRGTIAVVDAQEQLLIAKTKFADQLAELKLTDALGGAGAAAALAK